MTFSKELMQWYALHRRDMPWRRTRDPYCIWLSEIILQQTRIEQGTPYYEKFIAAYPTVKNLAEADEQDVLKLWQGLGYYSRARNLHATARTIVTDHGGEFPASYPAIRQLKGIGDYTAAAIVSICFDMPYAVVDGNVMRFISRLFGITGSIDQPGTRKSIQLIANEHLDHRNPGDYNQALMEFGATVCTPANPGCTSCMLNDRCTAFMNNRVDEIPARDQKAAVRHRFIHYLVLTVTIGGADHICLNRRTGNDIWKNLYDFPLVERPADTKLHHLKEVEFSHLLPEIPGRFREVSGPYTHLLSHQKLHVRFYRYHALNALDLPWLLVPLTEVSDYPVPRLIERYLASHIMPAS